MTIPTSTEIYIDYPEFEDEPANRIQRFIDRSVVFLDEADWTAKTYYWAVLYYTLHHLASNPTPSEEGGTDATVNLMGSEVDLAKIKSIKIDQEYEYSFYSPKDMGTIASGSGDGTLGSTKFGRMFLELKAGLSKRSRFGRNDCEGGLTQASIEFGRVGRSVQSRQS